MIQYNSRLNMVTMVSSSYRSCRADWVGVSQLRRVMREERLKTASYKTYSTTFACSLHLIDMHGFSLFQTSYCTYLSLLNLRECRIAGCFCLRFHRWMLSSVKALTSAPCGKGQRQGYKPSVAYASKQYRESLGMNAA